MQVILIQLKGNTVEQVMESHSKTKFLGTAWKNVAQGSKVRLCQCSGRTLEIRDFPPLPEQAGKSSDLTLPKLTPPWLAVLDSISRGALVFPLPSFGWATEMSISNFITGPGWWLHTLDPRTSEAEGGGYLWVQAHPGPQQEFQVSEGYMVRLSLKKKKKGKERKEKKITGLNFSRSSWKKGYFLYWKLSMMVHPCDPVFWFWECWATQVKPCLGKNKK